VIELSKYTLDTLRNDKEFNLYRGCVDQPSGAATELSAVLSKSPMPAASKALALEYAANNIRFNTVSPAVVNTPMHAKGNYEELAKLQPQARMGEVSDVVDAVLYLQSAPFVTGENIGVDGGVHPTKETIKLGESAMLTYNACAAPSAKAPLERFAFNPGPLGSEEHNQTTKR
jgi:hypothetical protein